MTPDPDTERGAWLATCNEFEINLLLGWFLGRDDFDEARALVEKVRAAS